MTGLEGLLLRRRLASELQADTAAFAYRSVRLDVTANARALAAYLAGLRTDTLHLVGHSLGGLVLLKLFESGAGAGLPPGRIVLLGSPLSGSRTAGNVIQHVPFGASLLGRGVAEELLTPRRRRWSGERALGVIAGDFSVGMGRLVGAHQAPSDGTIFVDETRIDGATEHVVLHVSHFGLPLSADVAKQTASFLRDGRFYMP
jgi:pimeloyl-ACP methyl ester carboxylesterase